MYTELYIRSVCVRERERTKQTKREKDERGEKGKGKREGERCVVGPAGVWGPA